MALGSPYSLQPVGRVGSHTWAHVHAASGEAWTNGILTIGPEGRPLTVMSPLKARACAVEGSRVWFLGAANRLVSLDVAEAKAPRVSSPIELALPFDAPHHLAVGEATLLVIEGGRGYVLDRRSGRGRAHRIGPAATHLASWCKGARCFLSALAGGRLRLHALSLVSARTQVVAEEVTGATLVVDGDARWLTWWHEERPGVQVRRVDAEGELGPASKLWPQLRMRRVVPAGRGLLGVGRDHTLRSASLSGAGHAFFAPPAKGQRRKPTSRGGRSHGVDRAGLASGAGGALLVATRTHSRGRRPGRSHHSLWSASVFVPPSGAPEAPRVLIDESGGGLAGLDAHPVAGPGVFGVAFDQLDGERSTHAWSLWQLRGPCPR